MLYLERHPLRPDGHKLLVFYCRGEPPQEPSLVSDAFTSIRVPASAASISSTLLPLLPCLARLSYLDILLPTSIFAGPNSQARSLFFWEPNILPYGLPF